MAQKTCKAKNNKGEPCKMKAMKGSEYCTNHKHLDENKQHELCKYKPEYIERLLNYFIQEPIKMVEREVIDKRTGEVTTIKVKEPIDPPTIQGFCAGLRIHRDTFYNWCKLYRDFSEAYSIAREGGEHIWIVNGAKGGYNAPFAVMYAKNHFKEPWKDKQDEEKSTEAPEINTIKNLDDEKI